MSVWHLLLTATVSGLILGGIAKLLLRREFWPWFFAGAIFLAIAVVVLVIQAIRDPRERASTGAGIAVILALVVAFLMFLYFLSMPRFSKDDIEKVRNEIRKEYGSRAGISVSDVQLIQSEATKLTGYVELDVGGQKVTRPCEATMGADGVDYIWSCK